MGYHRPKWGSKDILNFFHDFSKRVASLIIKLHKIYKIQIIQVYTPTSAYDDKEVERIYENVEVALELHNTQYSFIISDLSAKVGKRLYSTRETLE